MNGLDTLFYKTWSILRRRIKVDNNYQYLHKQINSKFENSLD